MASIRPLLSVLVLGLMLGWSLAVRAETITIGFNSDWPPYSSGSGERVDGLLVSLVEGIIRDRLGLEVKAIGLPWARVQHQVEQGKIDAMVTFASDERRAYAWASEGIVFSLDSLAYVRKESEAEAALRADPEIETNRRFVHCAMLADNWTREFLGGNDIPFDTAQDSQACVRQLAAGRVDVYLHFADTTRESIAALKLEEQIEALPKIYASAPFRLLVSKKSGIPISFVESFDRALRAMKTSGAYAELLDALRFKPAKAIFATLEWPPYTSSAFGNGGAVTDTIRRAFARVGIDTEVVYLPWKRAIAYAADNRDNIVGYFPGYHCRHESGFIASEPIGSGPLVLAERVDQNIDWRTLDDLSSLRIGTVVGYANTKEFDERIADGRIGKITSVSDRANILKLATGKLDAAVIDRYVFEHLIRTDEKLVPFAGQLRVDKRALEDKQLFLCLRDDPRGESLRSLFNRGLEDIDLDVVWAETFVDER